MNCTQEQLDKVNWAIYLSSIAYIMFGLSPLLICLHKHAKVELENMYTCLLYYLMVVNVYILYLDACGNVYFYYIAQCMMSMYLILDCCNIPSLLLVLPTNVFLLLYLISI